MSRIHINDWAMRIAEICAMRSTCLRRQVGAVLVNGRGHILSTGYNGVAAGLAHCNDLGARIDHYPHACPGANSASGTNLDMCQAIHAEQNALLQCRDVSQIVACYVTTSPCMTCTKLLLNTSCRYIIFKEEYPHPARELWTATGRFWQKYPD
jgi:dCMP deaminase